MTGNQFYLDGRLYRFNYAGDGPPWPLEVWDEPTQAWQAIGIVGAMGPPGAQGSPGARALSGLLAVPPQQSGILDGNYLATMDGLAVLTSGGDAIATQPLRVVSMEEHVLTSAGDVIAV